MASLWRMRSKRIGRPDALGFSAVFAIIVAVILIIGMMAPQPDPGVSVDLARAYSPVDMPAASRSDALIVFVLRDGTVFFRAGRLKPEALPKRIRAAIGMHTERKVYIKADARVRYAAVKQTLRGVQDAGIQNVAFLVEQRMLVD